MKEFFEWLESLQGQTLTVELTAEIIEQCDILFQDFGREGYELAKKDVIEVVNRLR